MYAVIEDGERQYKVAEGEVVDLDLRKAEPGDAIEFDKVLLVSTDDDVLVGTPAVEGARVVAEVVDETKGPKIMVLRFQRRKRHRRRVGHRQHYTRVRIKEIVMPGQAVAAGAEKEGSSDGA